MIDILKKWLFRALCALLCVMLFSAAAQRLQGKPIPMFCGWGAAIVQTGSMEPAVPTGSLILIHRTEQYDRGEIITYIDRGIAVTHRVTQVEETMLTTKGDANNTQDKPFEKAQVLGEVALVVPYGRIILQGLLIVIPILTTILIGWDRSKGGKEDGVHEGN